SVAIGFAFRDILQNFLAGRIILLGRPFSEGDWIRYGDFEGNVTDISTRSTWMRTFDGRDVTIPNAELFTNPVTIMTRSPMIRSDYEFGVSYAADIDKAIGTILAAIKSVEAVSEEQPPDAGVSDLAGSSVNIKARWWTKTGDAYGAKLAVMKAVKQALDEAEIEIPFPQRDINLSRDVVRELKRAS
ncbi:MAG: mechanosensitive ion channel family protein, partial [Flavobacteriaceae bacterium]